VSLIELREVSKGFGDTPVLRDVELTVRDGSTTAILGASGSGKTTLLRVVAGFERVDRGTVSIGGRVVDDGRAALRPQHRGVGYVPQDGGLFPHLTVAGNVGFGVPRAQREVVGELIELVGLEGLGKRYPHQLSGGQQQRVALARALAIRPRVVLLDEPFSSLDASLRDGVRRDVMRVLAHLGATTVLVTHDQDEALSVADEIAVLREHRVVAHAGPRELYENPPDIATATAIGDSNVLSGRARGAQVSCALGLVPVRDAERLADGGACRVLVRPEQLLLRDADTAGGAPAVVDEVHYYGHDALAKLRLGAEADAAQAATETVLVRVAGERALRAGQAVRVVMTGVAHAWQD
jgi:iron(III) transport system ATP-binding protein